jgi:hypothetical protein
LPTLELAEILRLHGCRIPRFGGDEYAAAIAVYDWLDTEHGERETARVRVDHAASALPPFCGGGWPAYLAARPVFLGP